LRDNILLFYSDPTAVNRAITATNKNKHTDKKKEDEEKLQAALEQLKTATLTAPASDTPRQDDASGPSGGSQVCSAVPVPAPATPPAASN
jgi:hypothetical protein